MSTIGYITYQSSQICESRSDEKFRSQGLTAFRSLKSSRQGDVTRLCLLVHSIWLVVLTILKNMSSSMGRIIPSMKWKKKKLKPPTRYYIILLYHIIPPKTCQCEATFHTDSMLGFFFQPISRKIGQYGPVRWKKHMFETTTRSTSIYRFSAPNDWVWVKFGYMDI